MKVFNYIVLTIGIIFVLKLAGINTGSTILSIVGLSENGLYLDNSAFYNYIFGVGGILMLVAAVGGIVAGLLTGGKAENFIILPLIGLYLVNLVTALASIMNYVMSPAVPRWIGLLILCILGPITIGLVLALVEFFRGTD